MRTAGLPAAVPELAARQLQIATDPGPVPRGSADAPLTPVLLYPPGGRRTWWWFTYECLTCGVLQFGRARERGDVPGPRRAGCGHWLNVVAGRTLGERQR